MSSRAEPLPKRLVAGVLALTIVVLGLGAAVVVLKLKPADLPTTATERNVEKWRRETIANPDSDSARVGLGLALLEAGDEGEAQDVFEEALQLNPRNWTALLQLGVLASDGSPGKALGLLERAAKNAPAGSAAVPLIAQGDLLMSLERFDEAATAYRAANSDVPYLFDGHLGLAKALEQLGDRKGALTEYREAARFDPTNQDVAAAIARLTKKNDNE
jgi:tetratricopeptide (TPR) repeat protein